MTGEPSAPRVPPLLVTASEWAWRSLVIGAAVAVVVWIAAYLGLVVVPVIVGIFVAAVLEPVRRRFIRMGVRPHLAALGAFTLGVLLIAGVLVLAIGQIYTNWEGLTNQAGDGITQVTEWLADSPLRIDADRVQRSVTRNIEELQRRPGDVLAGAFSVLATTGGLLAGGLLAFIAALFFVTDRRRIHRGIVSAVPSAVRPRFELGLAAAWGVLVSYVRVTLTEAAFDSIAIGVAAALAGVPIVFTLSALVFMSVFIPIVGAIISGLLVVLVALVTKGFTTAVVMAVVVGVVQQFDANVLYPLLTARRLSIHPLATLLLVAAGALAGGLFGAFLAVPLAAMLIAARRAVTAAALPSPHDSVER